MVLKFPHALEAWRKETAIAVTNQRKQMMEDVCPSISTFALVSGTETCLFFTKRQTKKLRRHQYEMQSSQRGRTSCEKGIVGTSNAPRTHLKPMPCFHHEEVHILYPLLQSFQVF